MAENKKNPETGSRIRTIELTYRPVFDIHLNMAIDFETKMQINDRIQGVIPEKVFMPVAEKSNQVVQLNLWAVEEACEAIRRCAERDVDMNSVIIWVSVKTLTKKNFVSQVKKIVDKYEISPESFCFNITESILEATKDKVIETIKALRELGFRISIDDLGLEYTSLSNLAHYDVDYIGIHKSMIEDILYSEKVQNTVQGIIDFCKKIDTQVIVDGIETKEVFDLINKMGADRFSGPYFGEFVKDKQIS
ncbi:MAG: EAL domain-containing protein [Clostridia bacterium]|nr:EAL domain-containing protein [Clostridia bacterium]